MGKVFIPTGYMGSGSSAITDLLNEYDNCRCPLEKFEFVIAHCPNGILDLVNKLIYNNNALKSDYDIKCFYKQMCKLYKDKHWWVANYQKKFGPDFMKITKEYINELIDFKYKGYWYVNEELNKSMFIRLILRKPFKIILGSNKFKPLLNSDGIIRISLKTKEEIYGITSKYIYNIFNMIKKNKENIILDQFFLPFNLYQIDKLTKDDVKVIVVARDPRDVFIINKYIWPKINFEIPVPTDALAFCNYYKKMRESEIITKNKNILRINFEELVYDYDKTVNKIEKFAGLKSEDHKLAKKYFNPEVSIKNTQVFRSDEYKKEIEIITKELSKYLYNFPYTLNNSAFDTVEPDAERRDNYEN